jgi:hypothetical protein
MRLGNGCQRGPCARGRGHGAALARSRRTDRRRRVRGRPRTGQSRLDARDLGLDVRSSLIHIARRGGCQVLEIGRERGHGGGGAARSDGLQQGRSSLEVGHEGSGLARVLTCPARLRRSNCARSIRQLPAYGRLGLLEGRRSRRYGSSRTRARRARAGGEPCGRHDHDRQPQRAVRNPGERVPAGTRGTEIPHYALPVCNDMSIR